MKQSQLRKIQFTASSLVFLVVCIFFMFPFIWMINISLHNRVDIFNPGAWYMNLTNENYVTILENNILMYFKNSLIISIGSTIISLFLGSIAAYGFARYFWKEKEQRSFWVLSQRFLPAMAVVIPYFLLGVLFRVLDTHILLIICYTTFNIPFTIWMMKGFIEDIPSELEEAAFLDGCTRFQTMQKVVLPLIIPGLMATAIFCIINSWNEFVFANFLTTINAKTIPTTVMMYLSVSGVKWGEMAATGVASVLPVLFFAVCVQKYMIRGLTFGSVKG